MALPDRRWNNQVTAPRCRLLRSWKLMAGTDLRHGFRSSDHMDNLAKTVAN
ncbi:hypothetical protein [Roseicyclus mahoneyensis]|uniref:hypothetical protein n=1 Tax=Roseicyclus mahoneyensis TaxID=164332 RepID=UPI001475D5C0|nr:hypothetical protein [Roseicyclus mahoneyensis]